MADHYEGKQGRYRIHTTKRNGGPWVAQARVVEDNSNGLFFIGVSPFAETTADTEDAAKSDLIAELTRRGA